METTENKPLPNLPKPTDDVQLDIKTDRVAWKEIDSEQGAKDVTDNPKEGGKQPMDNPIHKKGDSDNPRDEVETVSP